MVMYLRWIRYAHEGGPLEEGTLEGYNLTCPWHYAVFDIRNATVSDATVWATELTSYPIKIEETTGNILINLQGKRRSSRKPLSAEFQFEFDSSRPLQFFH